MSRICFFACFLLSLFNTLGFKIYCQTVIYSLQSFSSQENNKLSDLTCKQKHVKTGRTNIVHVFSDLTSRAMHAIHLTRLTFPHSLITKRDTPLALGQWPEHAGKEVLSGMKCAPVCILSRTCPRPNAHRCIFLNAFRRASRATFHATVPHVSDSGLLVHNLHANQRPLSFRTGRFPHSACAPSAAVIRGCRCVAGEEGRQAGSPQAFRHEKSAPEWRRGHI